MLEYSSLFNIQPRIYPSPFWGMSPYGNKGPIIRNIFLRVKLSIIGCIWTATGEVAFVLGWLDHEIICFNILYFHNILYDGYNVISIIYAEIEGEKLIRYNIN